MPATPTLHPHVSPPSPSSVVARSTSGRVRGLLTSATPRIALVAAASVMLTVAGAAVSSTPAAAATPRFSYTASAFGTSVSLGSTVTSGQSALTTLSCTADGDRHATNSAAGLSLAPLAKAGAVSTTADTYASPVRSVTTASTADVSLLSGLVRATAVKAVSATTRTSTGYELSATGTTLTGLVVAGKRIAADTAPNTRIELAGIGRITVNEQIRSTKGLTVRGLHLVVSQRNLLGLAVGTDVTVSQAVSGVSDPVAAALGGSAYGSRAMVGSAVVAGASFPRYMPCLGTGGAAQTNVGAGATAGAALSTGTITDTVRGTVTRSSASGDTSSTVQAANLLNGLVKATGIQASAHASFDGTTSNTSGDGSAFESLSIAGHAELDANVAPNTKVELAGIGTLYLRRVLLTKSTAEVRMIELVVTNPVGGLAVGTNIRIGVASASIK